MKQRHFFVKYNWYSDARESTAGVGVQYVEMTQTIFNKNSVVPECELDSRNQGLRWSVGNKSVIDHCAVLHHSKRATVPG